jgi:chromosomal replication initiation ATPase DnaA
MNPIEVTVKISDVVFILQELNMAEEAKFIDAQKDFNAASVQITLSCTNDSFPVMGSHTSLLFIRECCAKASGATIEEIESKCRKQFIVDARKYYCYLAWNYTVSTLTAIGRYIGDFNHSTIIHHRDTADEIVSPSFKKGLVYAESLVKTKLNKSRTLTT